MAGNPFLQWMQALGQPGDAMKTWEEWLSGQLEKVSRNEAFLGQMGRILGDSFQVKAQMDRLMEQSLRGLRLPTQSDVEGLHTRLDALERRLDDLEGRDAPAGTGPDPRLDALVDRIEEVAAQVEGLEAQKSRAPRKKPAGE
ncbi:MAG: poly(R)-hydroxyalkanoic acid synthase subunit PhaE [bacterium]